jgi:hypothetical protein
LGLEERLLNYAGCVVLVVDFSEDEATAVDVDENWEFERKGVGLKMCEGYG